VKAPGEVLLVACYELGHQPLSVAWPAAFLERAGYAPAVLDVSVEPLDAERVRRARLVAIAVPMHTALRVGVQVAQQVRRLNSRCHVCFYGLYALLNADYLLADIADSVLGGEFEGALVSLAERLSRAVALAPGGRSTRALEKLAFLPPSRAELPALPKYVRLERDGAQHLTAYVEASRGCLHHCRHCPIPPVYGGRFFVVPREVVLADIRQQVEAGARHVTFGDPDFLNGPGHALGVTRAMHAEWPDLTYDFTAKVEHLLAHRQQLPELARLGCLFIVSAVESLSDTVLGHLDKGHTAADVREALAVVRHAGITLRPTWVAFTPWTTLDDYRAMLDFIESEDLVDAVDPVQYSIRLLVPPGSLLLQGDALAPWLREFVPHELHHRWSHPDPRMDALHAGASALVAEAAGRGEQASATFARLRILAAEAAGGPARPPAPVPVARRGKAPRLTEPWFC
jgi:radical SAM superfamily enzyme YgiQ (UPF0313 family)